MEKLKLEIQKELHEMPIYKWLELNSFFLSWFTREELEDAIFNAGLTVGDFTEVKNGLKHLPQGEHILIEHHQENKYVSRDNIKLIDNYTCIVPTTYQGKQSEQIFRALMNATFKWFRHFHWDIYNMVGVHIGGAFEFYLQTSVGAVTVPLSAIFAGDTQAVYNFHLDYYTNYWEHSKMEGWEKKLEESLKPLSSPEYGKFCDVLNKMKDI